MWSAFRYQQNIPRCEAMFLIADVHAKFTVQHLKNLILGAMQIQWRRVAF